MPFYVPLGPRGILMRLGTLFIGLVGAWVYWRASRRRALAHLPLVAAVSYPDA